MTIRHISIFAAVADCLSMTAAAKKLFISQPTVSQSVAELERDLETKLFERIGGKLYLTQGGVQFLEYSRHILSLVDEAFDTISQRGRLRVSSTLTVGTTVFNGILLRFSKKNPGCELTFRCENTGAVEEKILSNQIDIALVEGTIRSPQIITEDVMDDELVLIVPPSHRFSKQKSVRASDLSQERFIIREEGSGTREIFEQTMLLHNIQYHTAGILNNAEAIKLAVSAGLGISVISRRAITREIKRNELAAVKITDLVFLRKFRMAYHRNKFITPHMELFMKLCREEGRRANDRPERRSRLAGRA
jgi:DNA-binding transcriptional LysR family regulator